ncbi:MAG: hypothetical protein JWR85_4190 [Marmoricola sp.]|nr:hypothetical protein [Marmoricola sp.]
MARTPGSKNRPKLPRSDDAYGQVFLDAPLSTRQAAAANAMGSAYLLPEMILQDAYLANGFGRRIVDCVAEEMTRAGFDLEGETLDPAIKDNVQSRFEELNAMVHFCNAIKWARAFGGSAIVLGIKDGGTFTTPLDPTKIQAIEFMRVYDRFELSIASKYENVNKENYGRAEIWRVSPATGGSPYEVHESRIFIFDGDPIPNRLRQQNSGWGAAVLQKCLVELRRMNNGHKWAELLLERSQQAVHGIPDLSNTLASPEGEALVTKRVDVVDRVRNAQNTIVIDALETFEVKSASLGGVSDVIDRFAEALSAVTGIPVFVLMGRSPGGLNATGAANEAAWYADIGNKQNTILKNPLDLLVSYIISEGNGGANDGNDYTLKFNPLSVPGDKDEAETESKRALARKADADTAKLYVDMGALDPSEVRDSLADDSEYMDFIDDSLEPIPPAQVLAEQAGQQQIAAIGATAKAKPPAAKPAGRKPARAKR